MTINHQSTSHRTSEEELTSLANLLQLGADQFTLAFVRYTNPNQRDQIIARLKGKLPDWSIASVSLQDTGLDLRNLSGKFFDNLREIAERDAESADFNAVLLLDWERRFDADRPPEQQPSTSLAGVFNMGRNLLENTFNCPFVVFLPQEAMTTLIKLATDFVSWQSGAFAFPDDFEETEATPEPDAPVLPAPDIIPWEVFRGAAALTEQDGIYGREEDLRQILKMLIEPTFRCGTLWGETGCGKTSLIQGGLIGALRRQGHLPVYVNRYQHSEADVCRRVAEAAGTEIADTLAETIQNALTDRDGSVFLLCDQFEQVFLDTTMSTRQDRKPFLGSLANCINDLRLPVRFLFMLRADQLYDLAEFDAFTPLRHPLAEDNRYELRWLREADAERVLTHLREEAGATWSKELIKAVVADLAVDRRVKPVKIQLIGAGLFLRGINTVKGYETAGGQTGVSQDYLNAVFDTLSQPTLARHIVHALVLPTNPPTRALHAAIEISAKVGAKTPADIQPLLDRLCEAHILHLREDTTPPTYELVHDVLAEPSLRAITPQEIGLSIVRTALAKGRKRLRYHEYRAAKRSDLTELPEPQQPLAESLLRQTFWTNVATLTVSTVCMVLLLLTAIQYSTMHVYIENYPPEPLMMRRGMRRLDFLPGLLRPKQVFDTGLSADDLRPRQPPRGRSRAVKKCFNSSVISIRLLKVGGGVLLGIGRVVYSFDLMKYGTDKTASEFPIISAKEDYCLKSPR